MRTEFKIADDPRLLAGLRGAVEHIANQHGLGKNEQMELAITAERECQRKLSDSGRSDAVCAVTIDSFEDRLEIRVDASPNSSNGHVPAILVKHFQRNPTHS